MNKEIADGFFIDFMEFEDPINGDTNNAYLSKKVGYKIYSGSLAFVEDFGEIVDGDDTINVPRSILNMALKWAQKQGY